MFIRMLVRRGLDLRNEGDGSDTKLVDVDCTKLHELECTTTFSLIKHADFAEAATRSIAAGAPRLKGQV